MRPSWYCVTFSNDDVMAHKHIAMQYEFQALLFADRGPQDAAIFFNNDLALGHQYYFSPSAVSFSMQLIGRYQGQPCPPPDPAALSLFAGADKI